MAENDKSIFNKLNDFLLYKGGFDGQFQAPEEKTVLKADTYEDLLKKRIEVQQQEQLYSQFYKVEKNQLQRTMQYEAQRLPAFMDFEGMEYYPMIASALDLYAEEATTIGENGKMLNIYSKSERIKKILEDLFYDVVNVNTNLVSWARTMPIKEDSMIPLLDGTEITIKELSERLKTNPDKEIWTYSVQDNTNRILPGKIIWCDLTRKDSKIVRVTFDDGTFVETTPDHEYILRNGKKQQAKDLKIGQSIMPFYTRISKRYKDNLNGYEKVYNPSTNEYKYTHGLVAHELIRDVDYEKSINEKFDTHHANFKKLDNPPSNLIRMTSKDHSKLHYDNALKILHNPDVTAKRMAGIDRYLRSPERRERLSKEMQGKYPEPFEIYNKSYLHKKHNKIRKESMLNHWANDNYKKESSKKMMLYLSDDNINFIKNIIKNTDNFISKPELCNILVNNEKFINEFKLTNTHNKRNVIKSVNTTTIDNLIERKTGLSYYDFYVKENNNISNNKDFLRALKISTSKKQKEIINHKVVSVEWLEETSDVYCMEVVGPNGEHDRHNFAVCSKDINGNYTRNGVFVSNCKYGDNFIYMLPEKGKGITMFQQLPVFEIERREDVVQNKLKVWFKRRDTGQEYTPMEIAHFRLSGDDKYYPYGTSILTKARRVWRQCLDENTEIWTPSGSIKIKDIQIGDTIFSYNTDTESFFESIVKNKSYNGIKDRYKISTKNKRIVATDDHLFLIKNINGYEYKDIRNINISTDLLVDDERNFQKITDIIKLDSGHVWDIEVDNEYHNFIAEGLVVHNCIMAEDAMLSYRILRAGEKRVFKVDVGNMDVNDIEPYIQKVATKFKRSPQVNRDNGNIDHRFNILGNDEDYFIPVRNSNAGTVIDTLPGGESLDKIADIEYLRDNLFTSLGVPKPFLGYQNTAGEGKNLAQQDMRFSKKVNRIQQSLIQELNKIAIIHLYLLGFEDELDNFRLSLSSPSNQAELLKTELLTLKIQLYNDITSAQDNGIAATSHSWAKKNILNFSEDEIIKDYENQMMERVLIQELQNATNMFSKTGIFDSIIGKYGVKKGETAISAPDKGDELDNNVDMGEFGKEIGPPEGPTEMPEMGESFRTRNNNLILENIHGSLRNGEKEFLNEYKSTKEKSNELLNRTLDSIKEIEKNLSKKKKK